MPTEVALKDSIIDFPGQTRTHLAKDPEIFGGEVLGGGEASAARSQVTTGGEQAQY